MDDREEFRSVGAVVLNDRGVLEMLAEIGLLTAVAGKAVGQQIRARNFHKLSDGMVDTRDVRNIIPHRYFLVDLRGTNRLERFASCSKNR